MEDLLQQMLNKLSDISDLLSEISGKLDNINGTYNLDDIVTKIDEVGAGIYESINIATTDIVGETRYNLTDIHEAINTATDDIVGETRYNLTDIHNALSDIDTTIMQKD